jgi:hypothetical protein
MAFFKSQFGVFGSQIKNLRNDAQLRMSTFWSLFQNADGVKAENTGCRFCGKKGKEEESWQSLLRK